MKKKQQKKIKYFSRRRKTIDNDWFDIFDIILRDTLLCIFILLIVWNGFKLYWWKNCLKYFSHCACNGYSKYLRILISKALLKRLFWRKSTHYCINLRNFRWNVILFLNDKTSLISFLFKYIVESWNLNKYSSKLVWKNWNILWITLQLNIILQ